MSPDSTITVRQSGSLDASDQARDGQQLAGLVRAQAQHRGMLKKDEFYSPQRGVTAPTARALQKMADAQNISSEVVRLEWKNEENFRHAMCTAYVRAWVGPRSRPHQEQTEALTMSMTAITQKYIVKKLHGKYDAWSEEDVLLDESSGRLFPKSKRHQLDMLSFLADQFAFLDRLAITKCQARVFDKLLRPDAQTHYGDDEYDEGHAAPPESSGTDSDTDTTDDVPREPANGGGEGDRATPQPTEEPAAEVTGEPSESFPPSQQDIEMHQKRAATARTAPVEGVGPSSPKDAPMPPPTVTLGNRAQSLITSIEERVGSKRLLDELADALKLSKEELPPLEHAQVMQVFWKRYREAR